MDSKRFNIYAGSALGALLLFLLLNFFSSLIYTGPEHAGDEDEVLAFAVPVEEPAAGGEEEQAPDWAALVAEADPSNGERVFNKCQACHSLDQGDHGVGPSLHNVVGGDIAATEGFSYSDALTGLEGEWTLEKLTGFLENPQGYAPGTKMSFGGVPDAQDQVDVIAYLNQASDSPVELAPETTAAADDTATDAAEGEEPAEGEEAQEDAAAQAETETAQAETEETETEGAETEEAEAEQPAEEGDAAGDAADDAAGAGPYAELLANASAENGEKVYRKCQACHTLEEGNHRVGPSLWRVVGADIGSADGFNYSDAMASFEGDWTLENLDAYLESPREFMPGNRMSFPGLRDAQDRIDVITYINEAGGSPVELAPEDAAAADDADDSADDSAEDDSAAAEPASDATDESQAEGEESEAATEDGGGDGGEYAELLAAASAEEGEKVFRKCQACHTLEEGTHRVGPSLHGVIGSDIGSAEGFSYSDAMQEFEGDWTLDNLMGYLEKPNEFMPGNKMTFPGLRDPQDRINVFTYIDQADGERDLPE